MRYRFERIDPRLLEALASFRDQLALFQHLALRTSGDVEQALQWMRALQEQGYLPDDWDLDEFARRLEEEDLVRREGSVRRMTGRMERRIRSSSLEAIFGNLRSGAIGDHPTPHEGAGGREPLPERKPYEFGDDLGAIDFPDSIRNAVFRTGGNDVLPSEEDLSVAETEASSSCATAILIDVSHSMVLYGEDRITPAKQVALALSELILTRYRKDALDVVLFGDEATRVRVKDLPYVDAGPFHTNTQEGIRFARRILEHRHQANKQIFLITDGKPTVIRRSDGKLYRNTFGLDPIIVNRTLDEAVLCRRRRIPITTFMVASDPYLQKFIEQLTERNRGRAYFTSPDRLGNYLLLDFLRNRRRRVR
ncbi:MAG: VWA domain-containing protein [Candidatus Eisenbacteria bacterium]|nr:VWA domain-containing protein [Candidatus Latescibacterota bacterium]MBD3301044.1 VWA domain-containing protein [Candidatus Eisenbacteria bacterium]